MTYKFCVDCKHSKGTQCNHEEVKEVDLVLGISHQISCYTARDNTGKCKEQAIYFEPKTKKTNK